MRPQDTPQPQPTVSVPQRDGYSLVSERLHPAAEARTSRAPQDAAANVTRQQIESIYANDPNALMQVESEPATVAQASQPTPKPTAPSPASAATPQSPSGTDQPKRFSERTIQPLSQPAAAQQAQPTTQNLEAENPYERTHSDQALKANDANWQQYHTAWQQYYQQYFHRYYSNHIEKMAAELSQQKTQPTSTADVSPEEAMLDIRSRLRATVRDRATKVRKSRHFVPAVAALGVMLAFTFLQYNSILLSNIYAYVTPGNLESTDIIIDPNRSSVVGPDPLLLIPKINVRVPVVWDVTPDHNSQMKAMEEGVAWFGIPGANSKPGQIGNTVLSGHSSNDFFESGKYKFVFAPLEKLNNDDVIEIHYKGTLYKYVVTKKEVVLPTEVDKLIYETDKPMLTLITCTPLGTSLKRLLITAEQVSPSPSTAKPAPAGSGGAGSVEMPGTEPTLLERAFSR